MFPPRLTLFTRNTACTSLWIVRLQGPMVTLLTGTHDTYMYVQCTLAQYPSTKSACLYIKNRMFCTFIQYCWIFVCLVYRENCGWTHVNKNGFLLFFPLNRIIYVQLLLSSIVLCVLISYSTSFCLYLSNDIKKKFVVKFGNKVRVNLKFSNIKICDRTGLWVLS